jgi:hypothetical protein
VALIYSALVVLEFLDSMGIRKFLWYERKNMAERRASVVCKILPDDLVLDEKRA